MYSGSSSPDAQEQRFFSAMGRTLANLGRGRHGQPRDGRPGRRSSGGAFGVYGQLDAHLLTHGELLYFAGDSQRELGNEPDVAGGLLLGGRAAAEAPDA